MTYQVFHWANLPSAFPLEACTLARLGYRGVRVGGHTICGKRRSNADHN
jgi:hypothetical protein